MATAGGRNSRPGWDRKRLGDLYAAIGHALKPKRDHYRFHGFRASVDSFLQNYAGQSRAIRGLDGASYGDLRRHDFGDIDRHWFRPRNCLGDQHWDGDNNLQVAYFRHRENYASLWRGRQRIADAKESRARRRGGSRLSDAHREPEDNRDRPRRDQYGYGAPGSTGELHLDRHRRREPGQGVDPGGRRVAHAERDEPHRCDLHATSNDACG